MKRSKGRPGQRILCINDGLIFNSLSEAAEYYNIDQTSITRQLQGQRKTAGGYHFIRIDNLRYEEDINKLREDALKKIYNIDRK